MKLKKLNQKGQTLVEYVLIISLVTVVSIAAVKIFGGYLRDSITKMSCEMIGKKYVEKTNKDGNRIVGESYCEGEEDVIISNKLYE